MSRFDLARQVGVSDRRVDVFVLRKRYWDRGYRPVPVWNPDQKVRNPGKQPAGERWQVRADRTPPEAAVIFPDSRALNTGIKCGTVVALDVDIHDQALVDRVVHLAEHEFGVTPLVRIGKPPKTLLCYQTEQPFRKIQTPLLVLPDGSHAKVEALAEGQQFVADGVHPNTGKPYVWLNATPETVPVKELPRISEQSTRCFIERCERVLRDAGGNSKGKLQPKAISMPSGPDATKSAERDFLRVVNTAALGNPAGWVLSLFPKAKYQPGTGAWRISSPDLGRDREEDLSVHPDGIRDFGDEVTLTPVDLVTNYTGIRAPLDAALWLCGELKLDPGSIGCGKQSKRLQRERGQGGERDGRDDVNPRPLSDTPSPECTLNILKEKIFPPVKWVVPDFLPEGLTVFAGSQKSASPG